MTKNFLLFSLFMTTIFMATSCDKMEPDVEEGEELITTVNYVLTPDGGGDAVTISWADVDGDAGNPAVIVGGTLDANTVYSAELAFLDESKDPVVDVSEEVAEEDDEHQVFFSSDVPGVTFTYNDQDADGNPLGLKSTLTTSGVGVGAVTITLRHKPMKSADGVSTGDITNAGGESDIEVSIPINVE